MVTLNKILLGLTALGGVVHGAAGLGIQLLGPYTMPAQLFVGAATLIYTVPKLMK